MIAVTAGRRTTLVASSRPPSPTSSSTMSAGVRAKARKAAAVVISKKVIGASRLARSHSSRSAISALLVDQLPGEADALVETHEMRRDVGMHAVARGLETGPHRGHRRAFALGAGDVHDRRKVVLRIAQRREQPLDAAERQIDQLRMQPAEALENPVAGRRSHSAPLRSGRASICGTTAAGGCGLRSRPRIRANVACSSARGTTWSTMPCSSRYSAR